MKPSLFFLISILVITLGIPAYALAELEATPLEWVDSGKELLPGYEVPISVKAEGSRALGGLADAGFKIADKRFGITQDGVEVYVFFEGHPYKIDELPWFARKQYNTVFKVKLYCPGTAPKGSQPIDGYLWLEVTEQDWTGKTHYYVIPDPGPNGEAPSIYWFTEGNELLSSEVIVGEPTKFQDCSGYKGDPPTQGEGQKGDYNPGEREIRWDLIAYGLAGALGLSLILAALRR